MSISEIAAVLGISKSYLYSLVKAFPAEKPKLKGDLQAWADFIGNHRIEPIGGRNAIGTADAARLVRLPYCNLIGI